MTHASLPEASLSRAAAAPGLARLSLRQAVWRWHFYAGLVSVPFMVLLAVTGSLYLFKSEINHTVFAYRTVVADPGTAPLSPGALVARAVEAVPDSTATTYSEPAARTSSATVTVSAGGDSRLVYLNPYTGGVLEILHADREPMAVLKKIHSLELFGTFANRLIEAVAGFALILVVTGFYLWWPRRDGPIARSGVRPGGVVTVRGTPRQRIWWRDLHAVTGAIAGGAIAFMALSGLPWTGIWGGTLSEVTNALGVGYPAQLWDAVPSSTVPTKAVLPGAGWAVQAAPVPLSTPPAAAEPIGLDAAMAVAHRLGLAPGFEMAIPQGPTGVYTAALSFGDLSKERTVHIDQYSGRPLIDLGFKDYGIAGKAIELGDDLHQGMAFGLANQLLMLAICLAVILASVSALVRWWKRRPAGRLGVPPPPADSRVYRALWVGIVAVGIALPVTGVAILVMLAVDLVVIRAVPPLRRAFA